MRRAEYACRICGPYSASPNTETPQRHFRNWWYGCVVYENGAPQDNPNKLDVLISSTALTHGKLFELQPYEYDCQQSSALYPAKSWRLLSFH
jgi:hypothetical protein